MTDAAIKLTLTKAQWRTVESLYNGEKLYWSRSYNSYFIGVPGAEQISRRVQQITVFELKAAGVIDGLLELTPAGRTLAAGRHGEKE